MIEKEYLGDSVYVEWRPGEIVLTTENGFGPSNTIVMGEREIEALSAYVKRVEEYCQAEREVAE